MTMNKTSKLPQIDRSAQALKPHSVIGILGGGQLARMMGLAAARLGLKVHIYNPSADCPAAQIANHIVTGAYDNIAALTDFAQQCDVVTYEFENVPAVTAQAAAQNAPLRPLARALDVAQDRLAEKDFLSKTLNIGVAPYQAIDDLAGLRAALERLGLPAVLKTRRFGYDGKGQVIIKTPEDIAPAWAQLGEPRGSKARNADLILEAFIPFTREVSIIAARGLEGHFEAYPLTENTHEHHILKTSLAPAPRDTGAAAHIAEKILTALDYVGVMGVEFFEQEDGSLLVNEIAPRVHNSGHWTQNAGCVDQFEQHIRAIAGWPLGAAQPLYRVKMINLIGDQIEDWPHYAAQSDMHLHHYGKDEIRSGRKMGHINHILGPIK